MKYAGMPMGMWMLFGKSFQTQLTAVFGYDAATARAVARKAKPKYREIITELPEFEKEDRFQMNIVNAAMLAAFILNTPARPDVDRLTDYYARTMMTRPDALILPEERQEEVHGGRSRRDARDGEAPRRGSEPLFVEHGSL